MPRLSPLRTAALATLTLGLAACATYDDTALHGRCEEPGYVKGLHPSVAKRESRCDRLEWKQEESTESARPLDFSGRHKDD